MTTKKTSVKSTPEDRTPAYHSIIKDIQSRIEANHWPNGTMIPGLRRLAEDYGVSHVTVQQAVRYLVGTGMLRSDLGRGTYVAYRNESDSNGARDGVDNFGQGPVSDILRQPADGDIVAGTTVGIIDAPSLVNRVARHDSYDWIDIIATNIERELSNKGGRALYFDDFDSNRDEIKLSEAVERLTRQNVGGIILIDIYGDDRERTKQVAAEFDTESIPFVVVTWTSAPMLLPHVCYDNRIAGYQAADHLLRSGYSPIAFVAPFSARWADDRYSGASEAIRDARMPSDMLHTWPVDWRTTEPYDLEMDYSPQMELFVKDHLATAVAKSKGTLRPGIIVAHDNLGLQIIRHAKLVGLNQGADFGIIGFDDDPQSRRMGLTTLRPPLETLGKEAARMMSQLLRRDRSYLQMCLRSQLLVRSSTDRRNSSL